MIDIESLIITPVAKAIRAEYENAFVTSEYVKAPTQFPHISIIESDNYTTVAHIDSADNERFATIMYEVNVYSNKTSGKKSECRKIMDIIDKMMYSMNFTRTALTPVPNLEDATIYRLTARYRAETDGETIYRI